jgi:hypothetical protein
MDIMGRLSNPQVLELASSRRVTGRCCFSRNRALSGRARRLLLSSMAVAASEVRRTMPYLWSVRCGAVIGVDGTSSFANCWDDFA